MLKIVADLGNTRLKWARLDPEGRPTRSISLPLDDESVWKAVWDEWHREEPEGSSWILSTVNPPVARRLDLFLREQGARELTWYLTAAEVPLKAEVEGADTGGSDRALVVFTAQQMMPEGRPGLVVMCGTAITVERVSAGGVWQGGAIAMGLGLCARSLNLYTAQLPLVHPDETAPFWGRGTRDSLEAGVFWGTVGAVRELISRQIFDQGGEPWIVWTGGDAHRLAHAVSGPDVRIIQDMVLLGLAILAKSGGRSGNQIDR